MAGEFRHKDVVAGRIRETEYEDVNQHILNNQAKRDMVIAPTATQLGRLAIGATDTILSVQGGLPVWRTPANILTDLSGQAGAAFDFNSQNLTSVGGMTLTDGSIIQTVDVDDENVLFKAYDIGVGQIEVMRLQGAAEPYVRFGSGDWQVKIQHDQAGIQFGDKTNSWDVLLKGEPNSIRIRNIADNAYRDFVVREISFTTNLVSSLNGAEFRANNADNGYLRWTARDNGVTVVEIARLQGADDPFLQVGRNDINVADGSVTDNLVILGGRGAQASGNETGVGVAFYLGNDQATPENE